mmetsp:Transcript_8330/g.24937  ORF Transcript_8330/g.24937 Transcript_8330/m.24937 type:complete len:263 (-) Transcript_8330:3761-4549(-)
MYEPCVHCFSGVCYAGTAEWSAMFYKLMSSTLREGCKDFDLLQLHSSCASSIGLLNITSCQKQCQRRGHNAPQRHIMPGRRCKQIISNRGACPNRQRAQSQAAALLTVNRMRRPAVKATAVSSSAACGRERQRYYSYDWMLAVFLAALLAPVAVQAANCPAGYGVGYGPGGCDPCKPGFAKLSVGRSKCTPCAPHTIQPVSGRTRCIACASNRTNNDERTYCKLLPPGTPPRAKVEPTKAPPRVPTRKPTLSKVHPQLVRND